MRPDRLASLVVIFTLVVLLSPPNGAQAAAATNLGLGQCGTGACLEVRDPRVDVGNDGNAFETRTHQIVRNPHPSPVAAHLLFVFPFGDAAAAEGLTVRVDGVPVAFEPLDAEVRGQIFDVLVGAGAPSDPRWAGVVRQDTMRSAVLSVPPGEERRIEVVYVQVVPDAPAVKLPPHAGVRLVGADGDDLAINRIGKDERVGERVASGHGLEIAYGGAGTAPLEWRFEDAHGAEPDPVRSAGHLRLYRMSGPDYPFVGNGPGGRMELRQADGGADAGAPTRPPDGDAGGGNAESPAATAFVKAGGSMLGLIGASPALGGKGQHYWAAASGLVGVVSSGWTIFPGSGALSKPGDQAAAQRTSDELGTAGAMAEGANGLLPLLIGAGVSQLEKQASSVATGPGAIVNGGFAVASGIAWYKASELPPGAEATWDQARTWNQAGSILLVLGGGLAIASGGALVLAAAAGIVGVAGGTTLVAGAASLAVVGATARLLSDLCGFAGAVLPDAYSGVAPGNNGSSPPRIDDRGVVPQPSAPWGVGPVLPDGPALWDDGSVTPGKLEADAFEPTRPGKATPWDIGPTRPGKATPQDRGAARPGKATPRDNRPAPPGKTRPRGGSNDRPSGVGSGTSSGGTSSSGNGATSGYHGDGVERVRPDSGWERDTAGNGTGTSGQSEGAERSPAPRDDAAKPVAASKEGSGSSTSEKSSGATKDTPANTAPPADTPHPRDTEPPRQETLNVVDIRFTPDPNGDETDDSRPQPPVDVGPEDPMDLEPTLIRDPEDVLDSRPDWRLPDVGPEDPMDMEPSLIRDPEDVLDSRPDWRLPDVGPDATVGGPDASNSSGGSGDEWLTNNKNWAWIRFGAPRALDARLATSQ